MKRVTADGYLAAFPPEVREILERVCETLGDAVPGGEEKIRYGMPAAYSKPIPYELIGRVARCIVRQRRAEAADA